MARRGSFNCLPPKTPQHQSDPRFRPSGELVDDKDVAGGPAENALGDASLDEAFKEPLLASAYDEEIDLSLVSEAENCLGGRAD
jgi:hypothetical protein